jgi:hypothetical protein
MNRNDGGNVSGDNHRRNRLFSRSIACGNVLDVMVRCWEEAGTELAGMRQCCFNKAMRVFYFTTVEADGETVKMSIIWMR